VEKRKAGVGILRNLDVNTLILNLCKVHSICHLSQEPIIVKLNSSSISICTVLTNGLVEEDDIVTAKQDQTLGAPSSIAVYFRTRGDGRIAECW